MTYSRCTDCERSGRGFEHRELVNERCKTHALAAIVSRSFVEVTYISDRSGLEYRVRGLLYFYRRTETFSIKMFARREQDSGVHTAEMHAWQLRAIRPVSDVEQAESLPVGTSVTIHHYGRRQSGFVVERARTRVLVRFRLASGRLVQRWKPAMAVVHAQLPTTVPSVSETN